MTVASREDISALGFDTRQRTMMDLNGKYVDWRTYGPDWDPYDEGLFVGSAADCTEQEGSTADDEPYACDSWSCASNAEETSALYDAAWNDTSTKNRHLPSRPLNQAKHYIYEIAQYS